MQKHGPRFEVEPYQYFLKPGFLIVNTEDTVVRTVLGNCVAVTLYDPRAGFGGINHFILPKTKRNTQQTAQYGNVSIQALAKLLVRSGASMDTLEAQIFGGARNHSIYDANVGDQNVHIARRTLKRLRVPIVSEDVGGYRARKLVYHTGTNETIVLKVDHIRRTDWVRRGMDISRVGHRPEPAYRQPS